MKNLSTIQIHNKLSAYLKEKGFVQSTDKSWSQVTEGKINPYRIVLKWERLINTPEKITHCIEFFSPELPSNGHELCVDTMSTFTSFVAAISSLNKVYSYEIPQEKLLKVV